MHTDQNYEQNLLDIEILAVQIEENNKQRKAKQAKQYNQQLQKQKEEEYMKFKTGLVQIGKNWGPITAAFMTAGIVATKTLFFGSLVGFSIALGARSLTSEKLWEVR
jgi:hypothetical protein